MGISGNQSINCIPALYYYLLQAASALGSGQDVTNADGVNSQQQQQQRPRFDDDDDISTESELSEPIPESCVDLEVSSMFLPAIVYLLSLIHI